MIILILLLGVLILYLVERKLYEKYWDKGLDIRVDFLSHTAFEGGTGTLTEVLENHSFLPLPFVHAKFHVGSGLMFEDKENLATSDQNYKNDIFSILFYQRITRTLKFRCTDRGYYHVDQAVLVSTDLFYRMHFIATRPLETYFYVYPGIIDTAAFEQPLRKISGEIKAQQFLYPDPFEFRGIRSYTTSDPMNTINWKASARTGEMMVNQYDSTTSQRVVLLLNLEDETILSYPALHEESIRIASTLAAKLLAEGTPVSLVTNGSDCETKELMGRLDAYGPAQLEEIYRMLTRIDLKLAKPEFSLMVKDITRNPEFNTAGYVMISVCQKKQLQEAYRTLSREAASFWVSPVYINMTSHLELDNEDEFLRWEVEGYA